MGVNFVIKRVRIFLLMFFLIIFSVGCDFFSTKTSTTNTIEGTTTSETTISTTQTTLKTTSVSTTSPVTTSTTTVTLSKTIYFEENGGSTVSDITQLVGSAVLEPTEPIREGYSFDEWYSDISFTTVYEFTTIPSDDITIYAKWTVNQYMLEFRDYDGTLLQMTEYDYAEDISNHVVPAVPTRLGYTFIDWDDDIPSTMPADNIILTALYSINQYSISFETDEGSSINDITQDYGSSISEPVSPSKSGFTFEGWFLDSSYNTVYSFSSMPAEDITVYAKWNLGFNFVLLDDETYELSGYFGTATDVIIPSTYLGIAVTQIGMSAFENCTSITSVTIPDSIVEIGFEAFSFCTSLINLTIPNSVNIIGEGAFRGCSGLVSMTLPFVGESRDSLGASAVFGYIFGTNSYLGGTEATQEFSTDYDNIISYYLPTSLTTVVLTDMVALPFGAFSFCYNLTSITLPSNLTSIADYAFLFCEGLTYFTIPFGVTSIGNLAFWCCHALVDISIPSSVLTIGNNAFTECTSLASITIPSSVTSIGRYVFQMCHSLSSVTIGSSVTSIGEGAFYNCTNLVNITIPASLTSIGDYVFTECTSLETITVEDENQNYSSENGVLFDKQKTLIIIYPAGKLDSNYDVPNGVTTIGLAAFSYASHLTSITISNGVISIEPTAFYYCHSLISVILPSTLENIGNYSFYHCNSLPSIIIPMSVVSVGENAFAGCTVITIYAEPETRPSGWNFFWDIPVVWGYVDTSKSTISFNSNGGTEVSAIRQTIGSVAYEPMNPTKENFIFDGWFVDAELTMAYTFTTMPTVNITLYAKWIFNIATISYYIPGNVAITGTVGWVYSIIVTESGQIYAFGANAYGELGDDTFNWKSLPIETTGFFHLTDNDKIIGISSFYLHTIAVTESGRVFAWGINDGGQIGNGTMSTIPSISEITGQFLLDDDDRIIMVAAGEYHSIALSAKGRVFTFGSNSYGQLGNGTNDFYASPIEITSGFSLSGEEKIIQIIAGGNHSLAISSTGKVYAWGSNNYGELGDESYTNRLVPTDITLQFDLEEDEVIIKLSGGYFNTLALTSQGRVFGMGNNIYGQLGIGNTISQNSPIEVSFVDLLPDEIIVDIEAGYMTSFAVTSFHRVFAWGYNYSGEMGDGTSQSKNVPTDITANFDLEDGEVILSVPASRTHSLAVTSFGRIIIWGDNSYGQLGDGSFNLRVNPTETLLPEGNVLIYQEFILIGESITPYEPINSGYVFDGWYLDPALTQTYVFTTMPKDGLVLYGRWILVSYEISYFLDGGINAEGNQDQYNEGTLPLILLDPSKTGYDFTGWFDNPDYDGNPITVIEAGFAEDIYLYALWSICEYTLLFEDYDGTILQSTNYLYGTDISLHVLPLAPSRDGYTFIGWSESVPSTMPGNNIVIVAEYSLNQYTISFDSTGGTEVLSITQVYGSAVNEPTNPTKEDYIFDGWFTDTLWTTEYVFTTMPQESITLYAKWIVIQYTVTYAEVSGPQPIIFTGGYHAFSITSSNQIFAWGRNDYGELGDGTTNSQISPVEITSQFDLNEGETIIQIIAGAFHSFAITSDNRIFAWGLNTSGQLGNNTVINSSVPLDITSQFNLSIDETIIFIVSNWSHNLALSSDGRVFAWGSNIWGNIGNDTTINQTTPLDITSRFGLIGEETVIDVEVSDYHSVALTSTGRVFTWGTNSSGQLGDGTTTTRLVPTDITTHFSLIADEIIVEVEASWSHTIALTSAGRIFVWGRNDLCQLGDGTTSYRTLPYNVTSRLGLLEGEVVERIFAGGHQSIIITSLGRVFTWGRNTSGQLGDGTTTNQSTPVLMDSRLNIDSGDSIIDIIMGGNHTFVITELGTITLWGLSNYGQHGDGTTATKLTPTRVEYAFSTGPSDILLMESHGYQDPLTYIPTKEGYSFVGWYLDQLLGIEFTDTLMPAENIILYAKWIEN